MLKAFKRN